MPGDTKEYNNHQGVKFISFGFLKEKQFTISIEMIKNKAGTGREGTVILKNSLDTASGCRRKT